MRKPLRTLLLVSATLLAAASLLTSGSAAASGFRCPTTRRLIDLGDHLYDVLALCGPPTLAIQRQEERSVRRAVFTPRSSGRSVIVEASESVTVAIDDWTYDFGPHRFVRYLTFENGRLVSVTEGDYGTARSP